jgi:thiamine-phosphate pyrophosphorylase
VTDKSPSGGTEAQAETCRIYLITPPRLAPDVFADTLAAALDGGAVACVQLRLKAVDDDAVRAAAERLMPVCHARDVAFIINDRPDLAVMTGADGAHIGAEDGDAAEARELLGAERILGVSCYDSRHLAMQAGEAGADYIAFGAFFPTATKQPRARATPELLSWWRELTVVQSVAIGGITAENCRILVEAGADFLAVIAAVWDHPDGPAAGIKALNDAIAEASAT